MAELFEKWFIVIATSVLLVGFGAIAVNEAKKVEKCNSLHGVMIDGKCLDIKVIK
jgi:hypothetical protein